MPTEDFFENLDVAVEQTEEDRADFIKFVHAQRATDKEVVNHLRKASVAVDGLIRSMPANSFSQKVRRAQYEFQRKAIEEEINRLFGKISDEIHSGLVKVTEISAESKAIMASVLADTVRREGESATQRLADSFTAAGRQAARLIRNRVLNKADIQLSPRVYRNSNFALNAVNRIINNGLAAKKSSAELAKEVRQYISPGVKGGVSYAAMRLARTEINNAYHASQIAQAVDSPYVSHTHWHLSRTHPVKDRCDILATFPGPMGPGTYQKDLTPFKPHPQCLLAGTVVSGPPAEAATSRWHDGEVVEIKTRQGHLLTVTPNHPILTPKGFVAAGLLDKGSAIICGSWLQEPGRLPAGHPYENNGKALVEDVFGSFGETFDLSSETIVRVMPEDFHSDGSGSNVAIIRSDGSLQRNISDPSFSKPGFEYEVHFSDTYLLGLSGFGSLDLSLQGHRLSTNSVIGGFRPKDGLLLCSFGEDESLGLLPGSQFNVGREPGLKGAAADRNLKEVDDLLRGFSGMIELDNVFEIRTVPFSGHVYNLQTGSGYYIANGVIVHNCLCFLTSEAIDDQAFEEKLFDGGFDSWLIANGQQPSGLKEWSDEDISRRAEVVGKMIVDMSKVEGSDTESLYDKLGGDNNLWEPIRAALHERIVDDFFKEYSKYVPDNQEGVMIGGPAGAGKGFITAHEHLGGKLGIRTDPKYVDHIHNPDGVYTHLVINPDIIKEKMARMGMMPERQGFSPMEMSTSAHEEASAISKLMAKRASEQGMNMVWDLSMQGEGSVAKKINEMKKAGYNVGIGLADSTIDDTLGKIKNRYKNPQLDWMNGRLDGKTGLPSVGGRPVTKYFIDGNRTANPKFKSVSAETVDKVKNLADHVIVFRVDPGRDTEVGSEVFFDKAGHSISEADWKLQRQGKNFGSGVGTREDPVRTGNVNVAVRALQDGKFVELNQKRQISVLVIELGRLVREGNFKYINLCQVTVKGVSLFCAENKGYVREVMPQLVGKAIPGSKASKLTPDKRGNVDVQPQFRQYLEGKGILVTDEVEKVAFMKATQNELLGDKVGGIYEAMTKGKFSKAKIFVSRDNYIVDGHHRWASLIGVEYTKKRNPGDVEMEIERLNMGIVELIDEANAFAKEWGIKQQPGSSAPREKKLEDNSRFAPIRKQKVFGQEVNIESMQDDNEFNRRLGRCYELAGKYAAFNVDGTLVHGSIEGMGNPRIGHAWVELKDGTVWEPITDQIWDARVFQAFFNPKVEKRYSSKETNVITMNHKHWGPWGQDAEVVLKDPTGQVSKSTVVDPGFQNLNKRTLKELEKAFPDADPIGELTYERLPKGRWGQYRTVGTKTLAGRKIEMSRDVFRKDNFAEQNILSSIEKNILNGWWPKGTDDLRQTFVHEFGHHLHNVSGDDRRLEEIVYNYVDDALSPGVKATMRTKSYRKSFIRKQLGEYATENFHEIVAAAFTQYWLGKGDQVSPIAKIVGEYFKTTFNKPKLPLSTAGTAYEPPDR